MKEEKERIKLTEQGIKNIRINLDDLEIKKSEEEIKEKVYKYVVENKIPNKIISEKIIEINNMIKSGKDINGKKIPKSQLFELEPVKLEFELSLEKDIPMEKERMKYRTSQDKMVNGSIDKQIKELKKALREGYMEIPKKDGNK